jgi:phospholipid transport system substrate-binding protein
MNKRVVSFWALGLLALSFAAAPGARAQQQAVDGAKRAIQMTIDSLVQVVEATRGANRRDERRSRMREVITPRFDFAEMSKSSLGHKWEQLNETQRKEFVDTFSELLAKTYLDRIGNIERGMVTVNGQRSSGPRAIVKTTVNYKGDVFPIDYKMLNQNGDWKVYDVVIENIGLVVNYRNEFAGIIRREQFNGLMKRLRDKLAKPDNERA